VAELPGARGFPVAAEDNLHEARIPASQPVSKLGFLDLEKISKEDRNRYELHILNVTNHLDPIFAVSM